MDSATAGSLGLTASVVMVIVSYLIGNLVQELQWKQKLKDDRRIESVRFREIAIDNDCGYYHPRTGEFNWGKMDSIPDAITSATRRGN